MPSLNDSLSALSDYTQQILLLSSSNLQPSGPYTTAYLNSLHLNPASSSSSSKRSSSTGGGGVLSLIRDAQESEKRLFRFIGEAEVAGVGRVKKVEKRDDIAGAGAGGKGVGGDELGVGVGKGRDEVEIMLRTALRLVDDYRPMPRARATITSLLETHHTQLERVAELELQIEEASNPTHTSQPAPMESGSRSKQKQKQAKESGQGKPRPRMTFEEAVKAEEAALRAIDTKLGPLRKAREVASASKASSSMPSSPITNNSIQGFSASSTLPSSPPTTATTTTTAPPSLATRTPAKTPLAQPKITNSLVNGTTPRRARATATPGQGQSEALTEGFGFEFDRFSPLKFLGTPRARNRVGARSNLAGMGMESPAGKGIFGKRVFEIESPSRGAEEVQGVQGDEDQTIRMGTVVDASPEDEMVSASIPVQQDTAPVEEEQPVMAEAQVPPKPVQKEKEGYLEGVQVKLPIVSQAIAKLQEGLPEMMRQGLSEGQEPPSSVESTITHLVRLSRSDPDPPPSPSSHSTSTLSSAPSLSAAPKPPPITPTTILVAHILLAMLLGEGVSTSMPDLKEDLGAIARARGWEGDGLTGGGGGGGLATKCIYHVVAKRVARIDRKGRGSVSFAI